MGLDTASLTWLCAAKSLGVDFTDTAMIGRQSFFPDPDRLRRVFAIHGISRNVDEFLRENNYSDAFFALLGAKSVVSVDYSDYEGATLVHDLNQPIPREWHERFSVVHDGGTIEHVFNVPQAFRNCMEMVRVGGHFTQVNVANNFTGHGFWQFSPELLFRIFSAANGFRLEAVLLHEVVPGGAWYVVTDPADLHARVELCNSLPTYVLTIAQRIARTELFQPPPQQSDYVDSWRHATSAPPQPVLGETTASPVRAANQQRALRRWVPEPLRRIVRGLRQWRATRQAVAALRRGFNHPCYRRIDEEDLLRGRLG